MRSRALLPLLSTLLLAAASARADEPDDDDAGPAGGAPAATAPAPAPPRVPSPADRDVAFQVGEASWYGPGFHGRLTANGEVYDQEGMTAAHRWLPFGTQILVTNLDNGCKVALRVTDRGPFHGERILDCSKAAAEALGFVDRGVARIRWDVVRWPEKKRSLRLGKGPSVTTETPPLLPPPRVHEPLPPFALTP